MPAQMDCGSMPGPKGFAFRLLYGAQGVGRRHLKPTQKALPRAKALYAAVLEDLRKEDGTALEAHFTVSGLQGRRCDWRSAAGGALQRGEEPPTGWRLLGGAAALLHLLCRGAQPCPTSNMV